MPYGSFDGVYHGRAAGGPGGGLSGWDRAVAEQNAGTNLPPRASEGVRAVNGQTPLVLGSSGHEGRWRFGQRVQCPGRDSNPHTPWGHAF